MAVFPSCSHSSVHADATTVYTSLLTYLTDTKHLHRNLRLPPATHSGHPSCFPIYVVKSHDQDNFTEERIYLAYGSWKIVAHEAE